MPRRPRTQYLFSYGSNNPQQLSDRLERQVRNAEAAYADGWERVFRGYSRNWGGGVASLRRKSGSRTFGYITPVTEEDLEILDLYEGVMSGNYKRQKVKVSTADGQEIQAVAYISRSRQFNEPTQKYLRATAETIGQFWRGSGGRVKVSDIPIRNPTRIGKYESRFNPVTPKQVVIRGRSTESLQELVPVAEEALYAMGATSVVTEFHGSIHPNNHFAVFVVEGLGEGKRWSSGQKKEFTAQVKSLLLPGDARPNFRNATGSDITEIETAVPSGPMSWGIPDSDRTQRAKRKSREMRKVFRRPNPRR